MTLKKYMLGLLCAGSTLAAGTVWAQTADKMGVEPTDSQSADSSADALNAEQSTDPMTQPTDRSTDSSVSQAPGAATDSRTTQSTDDASDSLATQPAYRSTDSQATQPTDRTTDRAAQSSDDAPDSWTAQSGDNDAYGSTPTGASQQGMGKPTIEQVRTAIGTWESAPKQAAEAMIAKYGAPDEMTATRLFWMNNSPWKWTTLTNDPTNRNYSSDNNLEQAVAFDIESDKLSDLAEFNQSIVANRAKGELSVYGNSEEANFLAINLAHDVSTGAKSVKAARNYHSKAINAFTSDDEQDVYMTGLQFEPSSKMSESKDEKKRVSLE